MSDRLSIWFVAAFGLLTLALVATCAIAAWAAAGAW
jgi:hypothetical protein